jgi:hypothetical protein
MATSGNPGSDCPCNKNSWCKKNKCYEECHDRGSCKGNRVPRKGEYHCDYSRCGVNDKVCVYEHDNYYGWSKCFGPGNYPKIVDHGIDNDRISSLQIPKGFNLTIYEHDNYEGKSEFFSAITGRIDIPKLNAVHFNDMINSMKITKICSSNEEQDGFYCKKKNVPNGLNSGNDVFDSNDVFDENDVSDDNYVDNRTPTKKNEKSTMSNYIMSFGSISCCICCIIILLVVGWYVFFGKKSEEEEE